MKDRANLAGTRCPRRLKTDRLSTAES